VRRSHQILVAIAAAVIAAAIAAAVLTRDGDDSGPRPRAVPATVRSTVMGMVSAAGSLGALVSAPIGQMLNEGFGWRVGVAACRLGV